MRIEGDTNEHRSFAAILASAWFWFTLPGFKAIPQLPSIGFTLRGMPTLKDQSPSFDKWRNDDGDLPKAPALLRVFVFWCGAMRKGSKLLTPLAL